MNTMQYIPVLGHSETEEIARLTQVTRPSPDNVHSLVNDVRLVNPYDMASSTLGSKHAEYSCSTAHI